MRFQQCLWAVAVGCLTVAVCGMGMAANDEADASLLEPTAGISDFIDLEEPDLYKDPSLMREWFADGEDDEEDDEDEEDEVV